MDDPHSRIGKENITLLLVLAALYFLATRGGLHQTMYQIYRPFSYPVQILPSVMGVVWGVGFLLLSVSFYYTLTVTSNNGWINALIPNVDYSYDALWGMEFVTLALIIGWGPTVRWLDNINTYSKAGNAAAAIIPGYYVDADEEIKAGAARRRMIREQRDVQALNKSSELGEYTDATKQSFIDRVDKYHTRNYWVKWGCFFYVLALLGIATTVLGFLGTKYSYADEDHSFLVLFWTWFVGYIVIVFGFGYTCYVSFTEKATAIRDKEIKDNFKTIMDRRSDERELANMS
jgi:hypothetical protein